MLTIPENPGVIVQLQVDKLQEVYDLAVTQLANGGDLACYEAVKLSAQDSIDTALMLKQTLPSGDLTSDAASMAIIDASVELLMEKYAQCDATLTTSLPSKIFD